MKCGWWVLVLGSWCSASVLAADAGAFDSSDSAETVLLDDAEADFPNGLPSLHPRARALEKELADLELGTPARLRTAERLIDFYRESLGHYSRAAFWVETLAEEFGPEPEGIDALFALADLRLNRGEREQAFAIYRRILDRIMAPDPPYDRNDRRCYKGWEGERFCKQPKGTDPMFPSDPTTEGQLVRLLQLLRTREYEDARTLLDQNLDLSPFIQEKGEYRHWVSMRAWLARRLRDMPPGSLAKMEAQYEGAIARLAAQNDWRGLADMRFHHPLPGVERRINAAAGDALLHDGMPALASLYFGEAVGEAGTDASPELLARCLFSRIHAGESLPPANVPDAEIELGGRKKSLREHVRGWQEDVGATDHASAHSLDLSDGEVSRLTVARSRLPLREWQVHWRARRDPYRYQGLALPGCDRWVIPWIPTGSPRRTLVNFGDGIQAFDVVDGAEQWTFLAPEENSMTDPNGKWRAQKLYVERAKTRTAVVAGDRVFCRLGWGHHDTGRDAKGLFALRLEDGAMVWSSLQNPATAPLSIAADPAVYRGVVVAVAWQQRELLSPFFVVGLSAETGELLWLRSLSSGHSTTVCANEHFFDHPSGCGPPRIVDGVAYLCTGAGVAAAVSVMDGTVLWAVEYPRTWLVNRSTWAIRKAMSRPPGVIAVTDDLVLFAPLDCQMLVALDRATGDVRYVKELPDLRAVAAADAERAYLVEGTSLRAMDIASGETVWRRMFAHSRPLDLPTISERGLLCSTRDHLFVLEPASGRIITKRSWAADEAFSYIQDFGDRLVGVSRIGLHVLAEEKLRQTATTQPSADEPPVTVPSRDNQWIRWVLPAVNRGDFVLSPADPDHMLIRSERVQMRTVQPVPTLTWDVPSPLPWYFDAVFDQRRVAVWSGTRLFVLDATTGTGIWETSVNGRLQGGDRAEVILDGDRIIWWSPRGVHCYNAVDGAHQWDTRLEGLIRGVRASKRGVQVYLEIPGPYEKTRDHAAILLEAHDGRELWRAAIPRPDPLPVPTSTPSGKWIKWFKPPSLIISREGPMATAPAGDVMLVDGIRPARVDWSNREVVVGEAIEPYSRGLAHELRVEIRGDWVSLRGRDSDSPRYSEPLLGLWHRDTLARVRVPRATAFCHRADALYFFREGRFHCLDLSIGRKRWQSLAVLHEPRRMVATNDHLLVLMEDNRLSHGYIRDVGDLHVFELATGERVKSIRLPKRWVHVLDEHPDGLMLWDCTWLYYLAEPQSAAPPSDENREILLPASTSPDVVASLRMAKHLEDPSSITVDRLTFEPQLDGDLREWRAVEPLELNGVMDWKPDFAHWSRGKSRRYDGHEDQSARLWVGRSSGSLWLAAEVVDDVHHTAPGPGLWRSDSLTLLLAENDPREHHEVEPTLLTIALVHGVPRFELGTPARTLVASDPAGVEPDGGPGARSFVIPPLGETAAALLWPGESIDVAIWRDEGSIKTKYELRINGWTQPDDSRLYWGVIASDNDGHGRRGGLQLQSAAWSMEESAIGAVQGMNARNPATPAPDPRLRED